MVATSLNDLYLQKLRMTYDAELQALEAIPELVQMASNEELIRVLDRHARETEEHVRRLEQLFQRQGMRAEREPCISMQALLQEARQVVDGIDDPDTIDACIIAVQQAAEHHEMAAYGTARTWARELGLTEDAAVLQQTLDEEGGADELLTRVAERRVNRQAARGERDVTPSAQRGDVADEGSRREETRRGNGDDLEVELDVRSLI